MNNFTVKRLKQMSQWSVFLFVSVLVLGLIIAVANIFVGVLVIAAAFLVMELGAVCEEKADKKLTDEEGEISATTRS